MTTPRYIQHNTKISLPYSHTEREYIVDTSLSEKTIGGRCRHTQPAPKWLPESQPDPIPLHTLLPLSGAEIYLAAGMAPKGTLCSHATTFVHRYRGFHKSGHSKTGTTLKLIPGTVESRSACGFIPQVRVLRNRVLVKKTGGNQDWMDFFLAAVCLLHENGPNPWGPYLSARVKPTRYVTEKGGQERKLQARLILGLGQNSLSM